MSLGACLGPMPGMGMNYNRIDILARPQTLGVSILNPRKSKTHQKIMKVGMVSRHGTNMLRYFFGRIGTSFGVSFLQTGASLKEASWF